MNKEGLDVNGKRWQWMKEGLEVLCIDLWHPPEMSWSLCIDLWHPPEMSWSLTSTLISEWMSEGTVSNPYVLIFGI